MAQPELLLLSKYHVFMTVQKDFFLLKIFLKNVQRDILFAKLFVRSCDVTD